MFKNIFILGLLLCSFSMFIRSAIFLAKGQLADVTISILLAILFIVFCIIVIDSED